MTRRAVRTLAVVAALATLAFGLVGAYSYANDYNIHRGFAPVARVPGAARGRLLVEHFYAPALHRITDYTIYLPPGYSRRRRYPVYYLLQGEPSSPKVFVRVAQLGIRLANLMAEGRAQPMILVYPDGRIDGRYFSDSEWANTPSGHYQSAMLETVRNVDERFSTVRDRDGRVLGGFSMGAYGALNIGLQNVREFASLQSWSGYVVETHNGVFTDASPQTMERNSPGEYVTHLGPVIRHHPLRVFLYIGDHDSNVVEQRPMAAALREAGAHVTARVYRGGHDWELWWNHLNQMLELASYDLYHPPARTHVRPGTRIVPVPTDLQYQSVRLALLGRRAPFGQREPTVLTHPTRRRAIHQSWRGVLSAFRCTYGCHPRHTDHLPRVHALRASAVPLTHPHLRPRPRSTVRLIGALVLALLASALINLGFVVQHRGHLRARQRGSERLVDLFATPLWLAGQMLGWAGWGGQILALSLAPLTLVQAFAAGSLAVSVPVAAWLFGYHVARRQVVAIAAIGLALGTLPLGAAAHGHLSPGVLIGLTLVFALAAELACLRRSAVLRAAAAGVLYGVADAAVKADAIGLHRHGPTALLGGWTVIAGLTTLGGFLAFQSSLTGDDAVEPLSLMTALTALTGAAIGVVAFNEALGSRLGFGVLHLVAIGVVLACIPPLMRAQQDFVRDEPDALADPPATAGESVGPGAVAAGGWVLAESTEPGRTETWSRPVASRAVSALRAARRAGALAATILATVLAVLAATGAVFTLRQTHLLDAGPRIDDALGLLQLAGASGQPLARVLVAWLLTGAALGVLIRRTCARDRLLVILPFSAFLLLLGSDAAVALTRNLEFSGILIHREPGLGPWLECLLLTGAALLPGRLVLRRHVAPVVAGPTPARLQSSASRP